MASHLIIIGAQRSGTTYLYKILDEHPEVYMAKPIKPEPKYFMNQANETICYDAYLKKYFSDAVNFSWLGEKSTSYIECEKAALEIKRILPDAIIVVILRDPLERAISHFSFTKDHGLEPYDIERAIKEEPLREHSWNVAKTSVTPYAYIERGKYAQYLDRWEYLFGKDQMILLVSEQLIGDQVAVSALYERLGIDKQFVPPSLMERVNAGSEERAKCQLSDEFRASLQDIFRPWNRELEKRYGLDLSCWGNQS